MRDPRGGSKRGAPERKSSGRSSLSTFTRGPEVDAQHQEAVFDRALRIADDREVLKVGLSLRDELLALGARNGGEGSLPDGGRTIPEPLQHRVEIQRVGHRPTVSPRPPGPIRLFGALLFSPAHLHGVEPLERWVDGLGPPHEAHGDEEDEKDDRAEREQHDSHLLLGRHGGDANEAR